MQSKASMISASQDFIDDLIEFSCKSMEWCAGESERAARAVGDTINFLLSDAKRISYMSTEAVALLNEFKNKTTDKDGSARASDLIKDLKQLCNEENEIQKFADPVIEALQFQDRITQMMDNMVRMIATWTLTRSALTPSEALDDATRVEFGTRLMDCTTMPEERNLIRAAIPGLPEEKIQEEVQLF